MTNQKLTKSFINFMLENKTELDLDEVYLAVQKTKLEKYRKIIKIINMFSSDIDYRETIEEGKMVKQFFPSLESDKSYYNLLCSRFSFKERADAFGVKLEKAFSLKNTRIKGSRKFPRQIYDVEWHEQSGTGHLKLFLGFVSFETKNKEEFNEVFIPITKALDIIFTDNGRKSLPDYFRLDAFDDEVVGDD